MSRCLSSKLTIEHIFFISAGSDLKLAIGNTDNNTQTPLHISPSFTFLHDNKSTNIASTMPSDDGIMTVITNLVRELSVGSENPSLLVLHDSASQYSQVWYGIYFCLYLILVTTHRVNYWQGLRKLVCT